MLLLPVLLPEQLVPNHQSMLLHAVIAVFNGTLSVHLPPCSRLVAPLSIPWPRQQPSCTRDYATHTQCQLVCVCCWDGSLLLFGLCFLSFLPYFPAPHMLRCWLQWER